MKFYLALLLTFANYFLYIASVSSQVVVVKTGQGYQIGP